MRIPITLVTLALAILPSASAAPTTLTACVARFGGFTRIVGSPNDCDRRLETVVQFNQQGPAGPQGVAGAQGATGPQGAIGPQGPAGTNAPALAHTLLVPASASATANGQLLVQAIAATQPLASLANPYLIQLDAGFYTLPDAGLTLGQGISLQGAGMYSTILYSNGVDLTITPTSDPAGSSFSISNLSLQSPTGSIASSTIGSIVIDHVRASGLLSLSASANTGDVLVSNSILTGPLSLADVSAATRFRIVGSEVDAFAAQAVVPGTLGCFATYNVLLAPYTSACH